MTKQTERELSIYDQFWRMNPDLIYPGGRQNTDVRDLARQMMRMVEGDHFGTVGYWDWSLYIMRPELYWLTPGQSGQMNTFNARSACLKSKANNLLKRRINRLRTELQR